MAKPTNNIPDIFNNDINKSIYADHLGLTPQFIKDNEDRLNHIENMVKKTLRNSNQDDPDRIFNTMVQLQNVTRNTFISDSYDTRLEGRSTSDYSPMSGFSTRNGFKMILGENDNREDTEIFNFHASIFSNYRNLVSEYRNIARLIPEIHRCADMKARDILAINEITKRAVSNIYIPGSDTPGCGDDIDASELYKNPINKQIETDILDRYKVEEKLQSYFMTALIEGAKPVAVFPFEDILDMAKRNMALYSARYGNFNIQKEQRGTEALAEIMCEYHKDYQTMIPDSHNSEFHIYGTESLEDGTTRQTFSKENWGKYRDRIINRFLSTEDINEYYERGMEDINDKISKAENDEIFDIYGSNAIDRVQKLEETKARYRDLHSRVKIDGDLSEHFKNQIFSAIKTIDSNIEFFDQSELALGVGINNIRRIMQFTGGYHEDPKAGVTAYGATQKSDKKLKDAIPYYDQDPLSKFNDIIPENKNGPKSVLDQFDDEFSSNSQSLLKDCLIKEYDAEDVIPVIVSGKHVGYYIIETSPYNGNVESVNKRNCNFTDMFINLGFQNDMAVSPSPASTGSFAAGVTNVPMGGIGPVSDVPSLGVTGGGSMALAGGLDVAGFDVGPVGDDATHRNNIMKKIIFNVLKQKIKRHDLDDDESFQDTIMSLIRDGAIVQSHVKIVYVPEKYMCYFTPKLDGNGIPQSFMKDCLFTCYEKILVNLNNIMTRLTRTGTKDKITVNIGKAKNMGQSIRSIENALTTRQLNVESPFTSLARVLKAASLSETIIVPVFDGEKVFEYEQLQQSNQVQPEDDLEQKLSNDIVTALKCPITITNPYQEEDFASLAASRNAEYRFDIIMHQKRMASTTEKFIKLLIVGSGVYNRIRSSNKEFNLKQIHVTFSPPEALNMQHANDMFGTVSSYVDNIIGITIDPNDDTESANWKRFTFKQKLYQKFMPGLGLDEFINMTKNLESDSLPEAIKKRIKRSVNDQIVNTTFEPLLADKDGHVVENHSSDGNESGGMDEGW